MITFFLRLPKSIGYFWNGFLLAQIVILLFVFLVIFAAPIIPDMFLLWFEMIVFSYAFIPWSFIQVVSLFVAFGWLCRLADTRDSPDSPLRADIPFEHHREYLIIGLLQSVCIPIIVAFLLLIRFKHLFEPTDDVSIFWILWAPLVVGPFFLVYPNSAFTHLALAYYTRPSLITIDLPPSPESSSYSAILDNSENDSV